MPRFTAATVRAMEAAAGQMPGAATPPTARLGRGEPRSTDWVFTWNNYHPAEAIVLGNRCLIGFNDLQYIVWGYETAPTTGTPHLQGFVQFKRRISRSTAQRLLCPDPDRASRIDMRIRRGTPQQAVDYCKKDKPESEWEEYGQLELRNNRGRRSELSTFVERVQQDGPMSMEEMLVDFPDIVARYPRFIEMVNATYERQPPVENHALRGWQADLGIQLRLNPDPRKIFFVVDVVGNGGKSWFADYWCSIHDACLVMHPAKHADMALELKRANPKPRVVFIDCPREKLDFFSYTFLEDLKNGRVFSTKYESRMIRMDPPHVVMLMNSDPDLTKLSQDRYNIIRI